MSMDFEQDSKVEVSTEKLKQLSFLAITQLSIEEKIKEAEEKLEGLKDRLKVISQVKIPSLMAEIGMSDFTLTNGAKVKVQPFFSGKIDDENREACIQWLDANGHGALMKKALVLDFGDVKKADWEYLSKKIKEIVYEAEHVQIETELKQGVHHKTLEAFIREQVTGGKEFPLELFKAYVGNKTKIIV